MSQTQDGQPLLNPLKGSYLYDKKGLIDTDMLQKDETRKPTYFVWK